MAKIILRRRKDIKPVAIWSKVGPNEWDWKQVPGGVDCAPIIQKAIDEADWYDTIEWPAGWKLATYSGLRFFHKPMVFTQDGGAPCVIATAKWVDCAMHVEGNVVESLVSEGCNLQFVNHYSGLAPDGKTRLGVQDKDWGQVGVRIWAPVRLRGITVRNFYGRQMEFSGRVENGSNCSGSAIEYNKIGGGYIGIYVQGPDNNAIKFIGNDIRDNYYLGADDKSFLGCTWIGNMFHNNQGGNIRAVETTQSRWIANYSEGNVPDVYGGQSDVLIGQQGPGVEILDTAVVSYRGQNLTKEKPSI